MKRLPVLPLGVLLVQQAVDRTGRQEVGQATCSYRFGADSTPLQIAAQKGHAKAAQRLILGGADVNSAPTLDKCTPLHIASARGYVELVDLLIRSGAKVDARTRNDGTPLHSAAEGGSMAVVEVLLRAGAPARAMDKDGNRPMDVAELRGHRGLSRILMDAMVMYSGQEHKAELQGEEQSEGGLPEGPSPAGGGPDVTAKAVCRRWRPSGAAVMGQHSTASGSAATAVRGSLLRRDGRVFTSNPGRRAARILAGATAGLVVGRSAVTVMRLPVKTAGTLGLLGASVRTV